MKKSGITADDLDDRPPPQKVVDDVADNIWAHLNRGHAQWARMIREGGGGQRNAEIIVGSTLVAYAAGLVLECIASPWSKDDFLDWCGERYDVMRAGKDPKPKPEEVSVVEAETVEDWVKLTGRAMGYPDSDKPPSKALVDLMPELGAELDEVLTRWGEKLEGVGLSSEDTTAHLSCFFMQASATLMLGDGTHAQALKKNFARIAEAALSAAVFATQKAKKAN